MIIQNNIFILIIDFPPIWSKYTTLFLLIKTLNVFFKPIFGSFSTFRKLRHPCPMVLPLQSLLLGWPVLLLQVKQQSGQRTALHQHHAEKRPCLLRQQGQRYRTNHRQVVLKDEVSPYGLAWLLTLLLISRPLLVWFTGYFFLYVPLRPEHSLISGRRGLLRAPGGSCPTRPQQDLWWPGGYWKP